MTRGLLAIVAGALIGISLRQPPAIAVLMIMLAAGVLLFAIVAPERSLGALATRRVFGSVTAALLVAGAMLLVSWTSFVGIAGGSFSARFSSPIIAFVIVSAIGAFVSKRFASEFYLLFLASFFIWELAVIVSTHMLLVDQTMVDVTYFQSVGSDALLSGTNPYGLTYPDLFSGPGGEPVYGPGVSVDGVLQFGYPYPPLSLILVAPFHALFEDFRIGIALAYVATAWMISRIGDPWIARRASILYLLLAPAALIVSVGFTEPIVAFVGVSVMLAERTHRRWRPFAFGAFLAVKQYVIVISPAYLLLVPKPWTARAIWREIVRSAAAFLVIVGPFLIWNPEAMIRSVVLLQMRQPLRGDAITFTAQILNRYLSLSPLVIAILPLAGAVIAVAISLRYARPGLQGFALSAALIFVFFFLFAKQSSAPNYFVVVMAFCFAAGAASSCSMSTLSIPEKIGTGRTADDEVS